MPVVGAQTATLSLKRCYGFSDTRDVEQCLISRLGDLQCLPSYLYTCVGNQIRQSWKELFHTASSLSLVSACHGLSICSYPYDMVGPGLGLIQMCGVDESQV